MLRNSIAYQKFWYIRKRNAAKVSFFLRLACVMTVIVLTCIYFNGIAFPAIVEVSEAKTRETVAAAVEEVLTNRINLKEKGAGYVSISRDMFGNIKSVQVNHSYLNSLSREVSDNIRKSLGLFADNEVKMPFGVLLGKSTLSSFGPEFNVKVKPAGKVTAEFRSQLQQTGINQTRHSINLLVNVPLEIIVPLTERKTEIRIDMPVTETVFLGTVPDSGNRQ